MDFNNFAYWNGQILKENQISISPFDRGFNFSDGVYEAIRSYDGKIFAYDQHIARLDRNIAALKIAPIDSAAFKVVIDQLLDRNNLTGKNALIYIQVSRGTFKRMHSFPPTKIPATIFISTSEFKHNEEELITGVKVITVDDERWANCDIKTIALLPNVMARQQAVESGACEAIFVKNGILLEGTHTNIFAVTDGTLITPPLTENILPGITRELVLEIAERLQVPIIQKNITLAELDSLAELMLTGTTSDITPVIQLDDKTVGAGEPGRITAILQEEFQLLTRVVGRN